MDRRHFVSCLFAGIAGVPVLALAKTPGTRVPAGIATLSRLERQVGGRLGVFVLDLATGQGFGWRAAERFAQCSTYKLSLAALALREIDAGRLDPGEILPYSALDVLPNSPVTGAAAGNAGLVAGTGGGVAVLTLAEAALVTSDNLAANLLLARLGGPGALTAFWRELGDTQSRLDRTEPALNVVIPGEVHDTVVPESLTRALAQVVSGAVLTPASRDRLLGWMERCATGLARLRAGLPQGWRGGDKTGTYGEAGNVGRVNDIAVAWPKPGDRHFASPLLIAAFYEPAGALPMIRPADEAVLASVGRIATDPASWRLARA